MYQKLIGKLPKIGIRPIIDGRRLGIRESLEDITMNMAKSVKELLEHDLKYPNGEPVKCVIADSTIGGVAEAAQCEDKFKSENVGLSISVTPCWDYGSETIDMNSTRPKAIWGFNGSQRPGAVYLAAAKAAHDQMGLNVFSIYGRNVQDLNDDKIPEDVERKLELFAKAGLAVSLMKDKSYLQMGGIAMGIGGSDVNTSFLNDYLGMRHESIDMSEFIRRIEENIYDQDEYEKAFSWVKKHCRPGEDKNDESHKRSSKQQQTDWEFVVKMSLIAKDLMVGNPKLAKQHHVEEADGHNALISGFQGQRQWTDHFPNGDFMEAWLNTSFDWNGPREPYLVATENDSLNAVSMAFNHLLTNKAQLFADVRTFWSPESVKKATGYELTGLAKNGIIHLKNSGSAALEYSGREKQNGKPVVKPYWEITDNDEKDMLSATDWCPADTEYFRGGGFSSHFVTNAQMPVTMTRLNLVKGIGPVLQLMEGYTIVLPDEVTKELDDRTDPTWPTTWFVPRLTKDGAFTSVYSAMNNWGANHGAISYGHIGEELITLASMLRVPVAMHNVPNEKIFRPSAWGSFGTQNLESADMLACKAFGPLYGKTVS
ncbi:L-fucose isomerase [Oenococcus sp. UCMA 17063]|nr:L-fucose isomerase [Oenococcus sp. UCMA 17063]